MLCNLQPTVPKEGLGGVMKVLMYCFVLTKTMFLALYGVGVLGMDLECSIGPFKSYASKL
jgi:hypothetical protein